MYSIVRGADYGFFKYILNKYKIHGGSVTQFCINNGWGEHTGVRGWSSKGIPRTAWYALKKDIELINLKRSLDERITLDHLKVDFEDYKSKSQ